MAYDFGDLAAPVKSDKKYDFGGLATPKSVDQPKQKYNDIPGTPEYGTDLKTGKPFTQEEPKDNLLGKVVGAGIETPLSLASSTILTPVAAAYGLTGERMLENRIPALIR